MPQSPTVTHAKTMAPASMHYFLIKQKFAILFQKGV
jgi:hypothetical protein